MKSIFLPTILVCLLAYAVVPAQAMTPSHRSSAGNNDSDSSYLSLKLSANKILLQNAVGISGKTIRFGNMNNVVLTVNGAGVNVTKTLPLTDSGVYQTSWMAPAAGNYKIMVKSSNGKEQQTISLDVYRLVDIGNIVNDNIEAVEQAYNSLEKQVDAIGGQLGPTDAAKLKKSMDRVTANKQQALKLFTDIIQMGKGLDGIEQKYGGLPTVVFGDLSQLSNMLSTQAQQMSQANTVANHKSYDNTICERLVMVSEACAAFSFISNIWTASITGVLKNISLDKGIPAALGATGGVAGNADMIKELGKVGGVAALDAESLTSEMGTAGFTGDLVQMCSSYFLKKYCVVMSGELTHDYTCTFRNKASVTYWNYSYTTAATISLRYPKDGSKGGVIKMKGNIEGNATKFTIYQKATEQDDFKDAKGYRASLFSICLYVPPTMPFSSSQADRNVGFGAVARAVVTPAYFNIPIDADYDVEAGKLKIYCNEAIVDFSDQVKYVYGYIMIAAGIPLVVRVNYPINKAKLTLAKVIEKNNDFTIKADAQNNLSFSKQANFKMGVGTAIEHNINFSVTAKSDQ
jgi:hypothetical protein